METNETFKFVWRIENFSSCYQEIGENLVSPVFTTECLDNSRWQLIFYPRTVENNVECYLQRKADDWFAEELCIGFEIEIITAIGEHLKSFECRHTFLKNSLCDEHCTISMEELSSAIEDCKNDTLTISCSLTKIIPLCKQATRCEARTKIGVNRCTFKWNVEETATSNWTETVQYPIFEICPIEMTLTSPQDDLLIHIRLMEDKPYLPRLVTAKIALLDVEGMERNSMSDKFMFGSKTEEDVWQFPSFIKKSQLKSEKNEFLQNGAFSLMCYFTSSSKIDSLEFVKYGYDVPDNDFSNSNIDTYPILHSELSDMLNSKTHSDVNLQVDGEVFAAHKCILAMRSPVFSAMFEQDMIESNTGVVDIPDLDSSTLKSFLDFLYTGAIDEIDCESASKLLIAADKYQVLSLMEKCCCYLKSILSVQNVCDILIVADMVGQELLKASAIDFIKAHSRYVLLSSQWCELIKSNCHLESEVMYLLSTGKTTNN